MKAITNHKRKLLTRLVLMLALAVPIAWSPTAAQAQAITQITIPAEVVNYGPPASPAKVSLWLSGGSIGQYGDGASVSLDSTKQYGWRLVVNNTSGPIHLFTGGGPITVTAADYCRMTIQIPSDMKNLDGSSGKVTFYGLAGDFYNNSVLYFPVSADVSWYITVNGMRSAPHIKHIDCTQLDAGASYCKMQIVVPTTLQTAGAIVRINGISQTFTGGETVVLPVGQTITWYLKINVKEASHPGKQVDCTPINVSSADYCNVQNTTGASIDIYGYGSVAAGGSVLFPTGVTIEWKPSTQHAWPGTQKNVDCTPIGLPFAPPQADAGPDQTVYEGTVVQLSGSNSTDPNGIGDIASYQWTQISGPAVTLSDPAAIQPIFAAPDVEPGGISLIFQLTVTDKGGLSSQDTCIVNVTWINQAPIARAGCPTAVPEGTIVQLDASGSTDADDGIALYSWVQKNGPQVTLSNSGGINTTFTAPSVGQQGGALTFELTVTDNHTLSASDQCIVNVIWVNAPPVANVGPDQTVKECTSVALDGTGSFDPDDGIASYRWTQLTGPPVTLSDPASPQPSFVASDVQHDGAALIFELTVTDNGGLKSSARCTVNVQWVNTLPVVDAGSNLTILSKNQALTILQGTASDPDGDPLTCRWVEGTNVLSSWRAVGADGKVQLNLGAIAPLSIGQHTLTLEIYDSYETAKDDMILSVGNSSPNAAPTGEGTYQVNTPVTLGGQVSDYDGDLVTYQWLEEATVLASGSLATNKMGYPAALPGFTISTLKVGTHLLTLQGSDGVNEPVSASITVNINDTTAPTLAPMVNTTILWPPNHKMVDIMITANAGDNSGMPVNLRAVVASNEPENGLGDGDLSPDWTAPVIDQLRGIITLSLRAERSGKGNGRQYTVTITATDESGIASIANVKILVPHDQGNK